MKKILVLIIIVYTHLSIFAQSNFCGSATPLTVGAACTTGTNVGSTTTGGSDGVQGCWGTAANNTVWYQFTTDVTSGTYVISTDNGTNTDTQLKLFSNCSGALASGTNCSEDDGDNYAFAAVIINGLLTANTTYYIMVDVYGGTTASFCINIVRAPDNDLCTNATPLTINVPCISGTNEGASSAGEPTNQTCWPDFPSEAVWYSFVADDDSMTVDFGSGTLGANIEGAVYASCAGGTLLGCTNNGTQILLTALTVGNTYYVMVDGQGTNTGTFCIAVFDTPPSPPTPGSSCANPRTLYPFTSCSAVTGAQYDNHDNQLGSAGDTPGSSAGFTNVGAYPNPTCTANDNTQHRYWVDFVATDVTTTFTNNNPINSYPSCATGMDYAVYTGSCGSLTEIDCFSLGGSCGLGCCNAVSKAVITVVGTHYYVLITPSGTAAPGTDTRYLCITSATPSIPGGGVASNSCGSAPFITENTTYTINNANADALGTEPLMCAGSSENTLYVQWTAPIGWTNPTYVHMFNQDCNASLGMQLSVFSIGTNCSTPSPTCLLATNPGNDNDFTGSFTAVAGSTYLIALDGNAGAGCTFDFLIDGIVALPIELLSFDAKEHNNEVELKWTTTTEINNDYFTIERSSDATNW